MQLRVCATKVSKQKCKRDISEMHSTGFKFASSNQNAYFNKKFRSQHLIL